MKSSPLRQESMRNEISLRVGSEDWSHRAALIHHATAKWHAYCIAASFHAKSVALGHHSLSQKRCAGRVGEHSLEQCTFVVPHIVRRKLVVLCSKHVGRKAVECGVRWFSVHILDYALVDAVISCQRHVPLLTVRSICSPGMFCQGRRHGQSLPLGIQSGGTALCSQVAWLWSIPHGGRGEERRLAESCDLPKGELAPDPIERHLVGLVLASLDVEISHRGWDPRIVMGMGNREPRDTYKSKEDARDPEHLFEVLDSMDAMPMEAGPFIDSLKISRSREEIPDANCIMFCGVEPLGWV